MENSDPGYQTNREIVNLFELNENIGDIAWLINNIRSELNRRVCRGMVLTITQSLGILIRH